MLLAHFLLLVPIAAVVALVLSALKLDDWEDIRRQAVRSFTAMVVGTIAFAVAVELFTLTI